jgi:hypothetical protein
MDNHPAYIHLNSWFSSVVKVVCLSRALGRFNGGFDDGG